MKDAGTMHIPPYFSKDPMRPQQKATRRLYTITVRISFIRQIKEEGS
jgi:hypothetical protein